MYVWHSGLRFKHRFLTINASTTLHSRLPPSFPSPLQELYGNTVAGQILNCFSRLFTHFLQWNGLTCGFDDLLLLKVWGGVALSLSPWLVPSPTVWLQYV